MQVFEGFVVFLNRKIEEAYMLTTLYAILHVNFNGKKADLSKDRPMMDPWKDFNSTLFANIVSSLSLVHILGRAEVFCNILGPAKLFGENIWGELKTRMSWSPAKIFP